MAIIYIKTTIPSLPEAVRTTINTGMLTAKTPSLQLKKIQAAAAKKGLDAIYELSTVEAYREFRSAQKAAIEGNAPAAKPPITDARVVMTSPEAGTASILLAGTGLATPDLKAAPAKAPKKAAAPKAEKTKRVSLNPQPIIDAKVAALKELGVKLTYAARTWKAGDKTWTSQEFSKLSVESLTKVFKA